MAGYVLECRQSYKQYQHVLNGGQLYSAKYNILANVDGMMMTRPMSPGAKIKPMSRIVTICSTTKAAI